MYTALLITFLLALAGYIFMKIKEIGQLEERLKNCEIEKTKLNVIIEEVSKPVTGDNVVDKLRNGDF